MFVLLVSFFFCLVYVVSIVCACVAVVVAHLSFVPKHNTTRKNHCTTNLVAIKAAVMDTPKVKSDAAKELLTECASNALEGVSSSNIQGTDICAYCIVFHDPQWVPFINSYILVCVHLCLVCVCVGIVDKLSSEQRSQVMKFVFKCMATGKNCANLLVWHERLVAAEGVGIIMRALVDRSI